jgi:hypothetical protein
VLLTFLAWSLACGEYRLLPLTLLVASFVAQAHLTFVAPVLGMTAVGVVGLAVALLDRKRRLKARAWVGAAVAVLLVCWSAPLVDEAKTTPGNLTLIVQSATTHKATLGFDAGWRGLVHTVGVPPWWLESPRDTLGRIGDLSNPPSRLAVGSAVLVLAALAGVMVAGLARRRADVAAAGCLGLVLAVASGLNAASTPKGAFDTVGYTLRWGSPAGMCAWLLLGWSLAVLVPARRWSALRLPAYAGVAGVAVVLAVGAVVAVDATPHREAFRALRTVNQRVSDTLPRRPTRVDASFAGSTLFMAIEFHAGVVYSLRREGWPVVAPGLVKSLGKDYAHGRYDQVLNIDVDRPPQPGTRLLARVVVPDPIDRKAPPRVVSVDLAPHQSGSR